MRILMHLWCVLGLALALGLLGCAGRMTAQQAERQCQQEPYTGGRELVARFAAPIVERRNEGYDRFDVVLEVRELISRHMIIQSQARFLDRYITHLTERIYYSQPLWTQEDARRQVLSDCDADFLRALSI